MKPKYDWFTSALNLFLLGAVLSLIQNAFQVNHTAMCFVVVLTAFLAYPHLFKTADNSNEKGSGQ